MRPIPGPGTHPHDWLPDPPPGPREYQPHNPGRFTTGKPGRPITSTHPRGAYWREYSRKRREMKEKP
jgi:hypothetical protein